MRILALNSGSSSIKCALLDSVSEERLLDIRVENIGTDTQLVCAAEHEAIGGLDFDGAVVRMLAELDVRLAEPPDAVVHRIVHGGSRFVQAVRIEPSVTEEIARLSSLAPLHNPPALAMLHAAQEHFSAIPHIAVFDTAFHSTLPPRAREYALPRSVTDRFEIRRYGFHGISHANVAAEIERHLHTSRRELRIVSCHLGNGASVAAIEYGRSVETSMGMTPLEGLVMGTRSGDVDPGVLLRILESKEFDVSTLDTLLNLESGLRGLTGTFDFAAIEQRAASGDETCRRAITLFAHRVRKYVGAYAAVMGGVDVIAFTGGIGEHSALARHRIAQRLDFLGAVFDEDRNRNAKVDHNNSFVRVSTDESRVQLCVIAADEEAQMVRDAAGLLGRNPLADAAFQIPVSVSARHAHLTQQTLEAIFGAGYRLRKRTDLTQHGQFAAEETITLVGPKGRIDHVRLMGPPRASDQIEISRSDEFTLGIDAPVRLSGDLANTPGITLQGPFGSATIASGVICAKRHIHMNERDAERLGLDDHDTVAVRIDSDGRDLIFSDVIVRVDASFQLELHLDTDEANAAGIKLHDQAELISKYTATASLSRHGS
jgi:acetate kinase